MAVDNMFLTRDSRTDQTRFDGLLDDTRIWARALTEDDIAELASGASVLAASLPGDLNEDGMLSAADIDLLTAALRSQETSLKFDLDGSGVVDEGDLSHTVIHHHQTWFGDADLNGTVNFADFLRLSANFGTDGGWAARTQAGSFPPLGESVATR